MFNAKFVIVLVILLALLSFQTLGQRITDQLVSQCSQILVAPPQTSTDERSKCFIQCIGQGLNLIDGNGQLIQSTILRIFQGYQMQQVISQAVGQCSMIWGTSACDTAYQQWNCVQMVVRSVKRNTVAAGNGFNYNGNFHR